MTLSINTRIAVAAFEKHERAIWRVELAQKDYHRAVVQVPMDELDEFMKVTEDMRSVLESSYSHRLGLK